MNARGNAKIDHFDTKIVPILGSTQKRGLSDNAAEWVRQIIAGLCAAFLIACLWTALDFWEKAQDQSRHDVPVACSHQSGGC